MTSVRARHQPDDETLIRQYQQDTSSLDAAEAINELFGRYHRNVYLLCFRYVRDHDRAMDLSQEVLMNALRGLVRLEQRDRFAPWLFTIAHNRCRTELRRSEPVLDADIDMDLFRDLAPGPDDVVEQAEAEERLRRLIQETLDPIEQRAIWLRCFDRMPVDEITQLLGIDASTGARGTLQRARRRLRAALERTSEEGLA